MFDDKQNHGETMIRIPNILGTADVALIFTQPVWRIRRLYELGILVDPDRIGTARMIPVSTLPEIAAALRAKGWLEQPSQDTWLERPNQDTKPARARDAILREAEDAGSETAVKKSEKHQK